MTTGVTARGQDINAQTRREGFARYDTQALTAATKYVNDYLIAQSKLPGQRGKDATKTLNDPAAFRQMVQDRVSGGIGTPRSQFQLDAIPDDAEMQ